jgi:hypothetical protein
MSRPRGSNANRGIVLRSHTAASRVPKARSGHMLAAVVHCRARVATSRNPHCSSATAPAPYDPKARHPDDLAARLLKLDDMAAVGCKRRCRCQRWRRPPVEMPEYRAVPEQRELPLRPPRPLGKRLARYRVCLGQLGRGLLLRHGWRRGRLLWGGRSGRRWRRRQLRCLAPSGRLGRGLRGGLGWGGRCFLRGHASGPSRW